MSLLDCGLTLLVNHSIDEVLVATGRGNYLLLWDRRDSLSRSCRRAAALAASTVAVVSWGRSDIDLGALVVLLHSGSHFVATRVDTTLDEEHASLQVGDRGKYLQVRACKGLVEHITHLVFAGRGRGGRHTGFRRILFYYLTLGFLGRDYGVPLDENRL